MPGDAPRVVVDACVLAGTIRRHLVLSFAEAHLFAPIWSDRILEEVRRAIPKTLGSSNIPEDAQSAHADEVIGLMNIAFPEANRETPTVSANIKLPDPDDVHVAELAVACKAEFILTENLKDFPTKALSPYGVRVANTGNFLTEIAEAHPDQANLAIDHFITRIGRRQVNRQRVLERLKQVGLKKLARVLTQE